MQARAGQLGERSHFWGVWGIGDDSLVLFVLSMKKVVRPDRGGTDLAGYPGAGRPTHVEAWQR
jgi:hypothetical protein